MKFSGMYCEHDNEGLGKTVTGSQVANATKSNDSSSNMTRSSIVQLRRVLLVLFSFLFVQLNTAQDVNKKGRI